MSANSLRKSPAASESGRPVQDEWGLFDPQQAGLPALMRTLNEERPAFSTPSTERVPSEAGRTEHCPFCTETLPPAARQCPLCLRDLTAGSGIQPPVALMTAVHPPKAQIGAVYTLESPVRCPECAQEIGTIRVLRVLRTQVSFTSTLPRKGYVIICPECERLLSAELSGLI
jgi:hypothetical protein